MKKIEIFWWAICQVESGQNPEAVNLKELALGIVQIRPVYVTDVNRILGRKEYNMSDRTDVSKSREMMLIYLCHYVPNIVHNSAFRNLLTKDLEDSDFRFSQIEWNAMEFAARIHNGGPEGYRRQRTKQYWRAVERQIQIRSLQLREEMFRSPTTRK